MHPHTTRLLAAALAAAERGWHVFPLRPGAKQPALHGHAACPGTGPCTEGHQGWEQRATLDPDRIRAAWSRAPYNVGLATGPSGLCVLDLDTLKPGETMRPEWARHNATRGEDVLAIVAEQAGQPVPGDTLTVRTPSGGLHLYFQAPDGVTLRCTAGDRGNGLGWKIDTRAWGGYVVAAGSIVDGSAYDYLSAQDPAPLPGWLVERLTPAPPPPAPVAPIRPTVGRSRYLDAAIRAEAAKVHNATKSQRNATLYAAALALGQLVAGGALTEAEHEQVLLTAASRHISEGAYSQHQARQTIASGLRAGRNRPRRIA
ncbi:bifunctional DNA primase/polymerase [Amycolatopsis cynarae]|uniref:Bifunctional DNA primase/polymerase n=1 Tax=Amycolatopsis cynarae TaxID=2995223 RepID=A0ABY7AZZ7_9PSEU|nr:bifunctional DNA primase/polymerase [Amycolatopsis sp. HUAS 11-8]WAL65605.1 bifunctional DNA primase/polymerase [Amycolatopsis sp. HUAS 11-8]